MIRNFEELLAFALTLPAQRVAVVYPTNEETLSAIRLACRKKLARFILVGSEETIRAGAADLLGQDGAVEVVAAADVTDAVRLSIGLVVAQKADVLMKGSVDTSTLMKAVLREDAGIRTGRLLSDIFVLEFPRREE